jgi:hypothetical protein
VDLFCDFASVDQLGCHSGIGSNGDSSGEKREIDMD